LSTQHIGGYLRRDTSRVSPLLRPSKPVWTIDSGLALLSQCIDARTDFQVIRQKFLEELVNGRHDFVHALWLPGIHLSCQEKKNECLKAIPEKNRWVRKSFYPFFSVFFNFFFFGAADSLPNKSHIHKTHVVERRFPGSIPNCRKTA
jgi:hypothetical protein